MYKLDILMFDNGERYPILMGEDGFPHFYVTLYATTMLRTHSSVNTIVARLKAIQFLFEWERINDRSLIDEFKLGHLLSHSDIIREGANKSYGTRAFTGNPLILND